MREKEPQFTVTDRRKFTSEGELRHNDAGNESASGSSAGGGIAAAQADPPPPPKVEESAPAAPPTESEEIAEPSREETAQQTRDYQASSGRLDDLLRQSNPAAGVSPPMNFDRLVQSIYMTAAMQMGAGAAANEQPRIDIMGARQSIDMLSVLEEKTKGNLSEDERRLLNNALFDLRMSFLEIANAINTSAQRPPKPGNRR